MRLIVVENEQHQLFVYNGQKVICVEPADKVLIPPQPENKWAKSRWNAALKAADVNRFKADGVNYTVLSRIDEKGM